MTDQPTTDVRAYGASSVQVLISGNDVILRIPCADENSSADLYCRMMDDLRSGRIELSTGVPKNIRPTSWSSQ